MWPIVARSLHAARRLRRGLRLLACAVALVAAEPYAGAAVPALDRSGDWFRSGIQEFGVVLARTGQYVRVHP